MTYYQLRAKYKNGFFLYERRSRNKENMECCLMITLKDTIIRFDYKCDVDTYQREYVRQYMADKVIEKAFDMVANGEVKGFVNIGTE